MSDQDPKAARPGDLPDEEGNAAAQDGLRSDIGASLQRPRAQDTPDEDRVEPGGQRGPAGSGAVPGRGKLGPQTPGEKGAEQGPR